MRISDWSSDVCSSDLLAVLGGVTALPGLLEQRGELAWTGGALAVTIDEGRLVRIGSADLRRRQRREDRPSAGGQVRGEAEADVGDQRRPAGGPFPDHVEDVAAVRLGRAACRESVGPCV